jgi:hypothetical protein
MFTVRIEHPVSDYETWKTAFDDDPIGRERSGVRRHTVLRSTDDPNHVLIDLEFGSRDEAEAMLVALRALWGRVEGEVISDPRARILEAVETREYGPAEGSLEDRHPNGW